MPCIRTGIPLRFIPAGDGRAGSAFHWSYKMLWCIIYAITFNITCHSSLAQQEGVNDGLYKTS